VTEFLGVKEFTERLISSLDAEASSQYQRYNDARKNGDWVEAVSTALVSFKLRGASLAVARGIAIPDGRWNDASEVPRLVEDALDNYLVREVETHEPATDYAAAMAISEIFDAVLTIEQEFQALPQKGPEALGQIIVAALQLGEDATVLEMIAGGHWDEVARLRALRIGRPVGWSKRWVDWFAPRLQAWWTSQPDAGIKPLIDEALRLRDHDYPPTRDGRRDEKVPDTEGGMRAALKLMIARGQLTPPTNLPSK